MHKESSIKNENKADETKMTTIENTQMIKVLSQNLRDWFP